MKFYFDDAEIGLARETSHPDFRSKLTDEFYYDCADDFSPFGNDDGSDALFALQDWYKEKKGKDDIMRWVFDYVDSMGFKYSSESAHTVIDEKSIKELDHDAPFFLMAMDNSIIATAFGQYKITGSIDARLRNAALISIKRLRVIVSGENTPYLPDFLAVYAKMESDLFSIEPLA